MILRVYMCSYSFFFFNDTATTEIYTLSLHDALPICDLSENEPFDFLNWFEYAPIHERSEEHTSELQSRLHLVCRLLLEKKKKSPTITPIIIHTTSAPTATSRAYAHPATTTAHTATTS